MRNWKKILEENKNLTQTELAKEMKVSRQRISQLCKQYNINLAKIGTRKMTSLFKKLPCQKHQLLTTIVNGEKTRIRVIKRPFLGYCEMCGAVNTKLNYHYWSDKNFNLGIWVCNKCHLWKIHRGTMVNDVRKRRKKGTSSNILDQHKNPNTAL